MDASIPMMLLWGAIALVTVTIALGELRARRRADDELLLIAAEQRRLAVHRAKVRADVQRAIAQEFSEDPEQWREAA
jgi:hypothetical protein